MATPYATLVATLALALVPCAGTAAQDLLQPLDGGVEDADPLAAGLRKTQVDLRLPMHFERVYHVPGRDDLLMRAHGSLFAVFPRSVYEATRFGPMPVVPSNTVYFIGAPVLDDVAVAALGLSGGATAADMARETAGRERLGLKISMLTNPRVSDVVDARLDFRVNDAADPARNVPGVAGEDARTNSKRDRATQRPGPVGLVPEREAFASTGHVVATETPVRLDPRKAERVRELLRRAAGARSSRLGGDGVANGPDEG